MARRLKNLLVFGSVLVLGCCVADASAQSENGEKIYQKTLRGSAWILGQRSGQGTETGTGVLIDAKHRWVLTNYHVAGEATRIGVFFPRFRDGKLIAERSEYQDLLRKGQAIPAKVIFRDQKRDLVLLELDSIPHGAESILLAKQSSSPGQRVHSVGNPGRSGALWLYTQGTVRQVYEKRWRVRIGGSTLDFAARVVETQSPTNPGDSGGPLVNDRGELVGVTQGMAVDASLLSLFIDVSEVKTFLAANKLLAKLPTVPKRSATEAQVKTESELKPPRATEEVNLESKASMMLNLAKSLADDGKLERAKGRYEEIIAKYPNTKAANEAKVLFDRINK
jgi:S1-C subfamily serine protease